MFGFLEKSLKRKTRGIFMAISADRLEKFIEKGKAVLVIMDNAREVEGKFEKPLASGIFKSSEGDRMILDIEKISLVKIVEKEKPL
jgi:hypothetical protein